MKYLFFASIISFSSFAQTVPSDFQRYQRNYNYRGVQNYYNQPTRMQNTLTGAFTGGVLGNVIAHGLGKDRTTGTVAGAVIGGIIGHKKQSREDYRAVYDDDCDEKVISRSKIRLKRYRSSSNAMVK